MKNLNNNEKAKKLLIKHYQQFPKLQIQDIFKYIYQSTFGCEHMVTSLENAIDYINKEYEEMSPLKPENIVELDGDFCRVPLSYLDGDLTAEKLGSLFVLSSQKETDGIDALIAKTEIAKELIAENKLPFTITDFEIALEEWKEKVYPPVHHSDIFRETYKPSYRVIAKEYVMELADLDVDY